jgi:hypothetical protein
MGSVGNECASRGLVVMFKSKRKRRVSLVVQVVRVGALGQEELDEIGRVGVTNCTEQWSLAQGIDRIDAGFLYNQLDCRERGVDACKMKCGVASVVHVVGH